MNQLYVLYDRECGICRQCRRWLESQPAYVPLRFIPLQSPEVASRFIGIERYHPREQLLVVSKDGAVYSGPQAWIMCLWALRDYRQWSLRLSAPALLPWARRACELVSDHRLTLSRWLRRQDDEVVAEELSTRAVGPCKHGCRCG